MGLPVDKLEELKERFEEVKEVVQVGVAVVTIAIFVKKHVQNNNSVAE